jgi:hypothetical protein
VKIDGTYVGTINEQYGTVDNDMLSAYMLGAWKVSSGSHTIQIITVGSAAYPSEHEDSGLMNILQFDEFLAF